MSIIMRFVGEALVLIKPFVCGQLTKLTILTIIVEEEEEKLKST